MTYFNSPLPHKNIINWKHEISDLPAWSYAILVPRKTASCPPPPRNKYVRVFLIPSPGDILCKNPNQRSLNLQVLARSWIHKSLGALLLYISKIEIQFLELRVDVEERLCGRSSGQSSWLQIQRSRVIFPALPHILRSSVSGTVSSLLLEWKSGCSGCRKQRLTALGIRCADHATSSIRKSWHSLRR
jgi:hypothetical protein